MNARARTLFGDSPIAEILGMIERCAPLMMRTAGGALSEGCGEIVFHRMSQAERDAICDEYRAAWHADITGKENTAILNRIADAHHCHYATVIRLTKQTRQELKAYYSRNVR